MLMEVVVSCRSVHQRFGLSLIAGEGLATRGKRGSAAGLCPG